MKSYCKNQELTKNLHYMKDREAVQKMISLLKELNAELSFIKWGLPLSTKPFIVWLVALFLFLLFSIFASFTLSYSGHALNHPFVFPCSRVPSLASQPWWLNRASAPGNFSVLLKEPVYPSRVLTAGNTAHYRARISVVCDQLLTSQI